MKASPNRQFGTPKNIVVCKRTSADNETVATPGGGKESFVPALVFSSGPCPASPGQPLPRGPRLDPGRRGSGERGTPIVAPATKPLHKKISSRMRRLPFGRVRNRCLARAL